MEITRIKLAALWIVVMFSITFADIIGFIHPGVLKDIMAGSFGFPVNQTILLVFSILMAVPIVMIFLCFVLPTQANRWSNTIAAILTIVYVIGGGSATLSYFFFATLEVVSMLAILWYSWKELGKGPRLAVV